MKTIKIKNKEYVPVVERIKEFHRLYPNGEISTEVLPINGDINGDRVMVKATVTLESPVTKVTDGNTITINSKGIGNSIRTFTGHSQAVYSEKMMGDVALEIAETSAIGRALGFANIGLLDGIASADEIRKVKKGDNEEDLPF